MDTVSFLLGILAGGVVASLIWIIVKMIIDSKEKSIINERNPYLTSIGEYIAEADSLLLSYSMGSVSRERLKSEITRLIDTIRKLYKPNLHLFEVFFVKYIETLLNYYAGFLKESFSAQGVREEAVYRELKLFQSLKMRCRVFQLLLLRNQQLLGTLSSRKVLSRQALLWFIGV
jgi:gas vesicle protein